MADAFVTILCLDTTYVRPGSSSNWPAWCRLALGTKLTTLEAVVKAAHKRVVSLNSGRNPDLHLFTAPEFTFAAHETLVDLASRDQRYTIADFAYDIPAMQQIGAKVRDIAASGEFPGLVLIPGTTFWKTQSVDYLRNMQFVVVNGTTYYFPVGQNAMVVKGVTYFRNDIRGEFAYGQGVPVTMNTQNANTSMSLGLQSDLRGEMSFAVESTIKSIQKRELKVEDLATLRNTAFVGSSAGLQVYEKMFPDPSEFGEKFTVFVPGRSNFAHKFGAFDLALEICADHANGALQTGLSRKVDIHLVMSATVSLDDSCIQARDDGAVVMADSKSQMVALFKGKTTEGNEIDPAVDGKVGEVKLRIFRVSL